MAQELCAANDDGVQTSFDDRECWIGFNDRAVEGTWVWSDGTPASFAAFAGGVAPWSPSHPDDIRLQSFKEFYDGAFMHPQTGKWTSAYWRADRHSFICRAPMPPSASPSPPPVSPPPTSPPSPPVPYDCSVFEPTEFPVERASRLCEPFRQHNPAGYACLVLHGLCAPPPQTHSIQLLSGWTWISSALLSGRVQEVVGNMSGLAGATSDTIKNQRLFADFIPGYGWLGGLQDVSPLECYRVRLESGGDFTMTGTPLDATGATVDLLQGWTWFGFPSLTRLPLSSFTAALANGSKLTSTDVIKSQFYFSSYISDFGWYGNLEFFDPGLGYMVKLSQANTLTSFGASVVQERQRELQTIHFNPRPAHAVGSGEWQLMPSAFEHSMCLVGVVIITGTVTDEGSVAAFVNGELRGIAHPSSYVTPTGPYKGYKTYNLMVYGQIHRDHEVLSFKYRHTSGRILELTSNTAFVKDAVLGSVVDPFVLS